MESQRAFKNRARRWTLCAAAGLALAGCGEKVVRRPNPTKPIAERRAIELIAGAFKDKGVKPQPGKTITTLSGGKLHVDVAVKGHKYGVAYLTAEDLAKDDADKLPKKNPKRPGALVVARGTGEDKDARIVVLFAKSYLFDDQVGADHEHTNITAEAELVKDARDAIVVARSQHWK